MEKESLLDGMEVRLQEILSKETSKDMEFFIILMEKFIKEIEYKIECMGKDK